MSRDTVISLTSIDKQSWREGWDELLDTNPSRPIFHRVTYPPRLSLNGILFTLLSTVLLIFMGFVVVSLPTPLEIFRLNQPNLTMAQLTLMQYTFQLPTALMIGAFLGPFMGTASILIFLAIGLFMYPVFANGGGGQYVMEPGFGYLVGMLFSASLLGRNFHKAFQREDRTSRSLKLMAMAAVSVLLVHMIGILYLVGLTVAGLVSLSELPGWLLRLTVEPMPYDLLATFVFLCLVRQLRLGLWLVLY